MGRDVLGYVKKEGLPDGCKELVDIFGMDMVMELVDYCGGNYKELAREFGISDIQVRKIVKSR